MFTSKFFEIFNKNYKIHYFDKTFNLVQWFPQLGSNFYAKLFVFICCWRHFCICCCCVCCNFHFLCLVRFFQSRQQKFSSERRFICKCVFSNQINFITKINHTLFVIRFLANCSKWIYIQPISFIAIWVSFIAP